MRVNPNAAAADMATAWKRSLNEWVGFLPSYLSQTAGATVGAMRSSARCIERRRLADDPSKDGNLNGAGGHAWLRVAIVEPHEFAQILREAVHVTPLQVPVADVTG